MREPWPGSLWVSVFPTFSSLSRKAFCKSFNHAHIFSHDRVLADGDLHPTITDEICIDSKIKSNEKKIGSQPDPTVPDCCIEVAKRHFFYCLQISINDIEPPHPPIISLNRRSDFRSFTKLITVIVSCLSGNPPWLVKEKYSLSYSGMYRVHLPPPIECLHPNTCFFRVTYVSMKWHVHPGCVAAGQSYEVMAHLRCKLHPCKWFLLDFSAQAAESSSHYPRDLKTSAPHKLLTVSPTNHHPESHQRELASLHRREERNRYPPLPLS